MGILRDKIIVTNQTVRHGDQHIHEHRAATDDSIRLAQEYQDKVWEQFENKVVYDLPNIDAKVVEVQKAHAEMETHLLFKVNGRKVSLKVSDMYRDRSADYYYKEVAEAITCELMKLLLNKRMI